MHLALPAPRSVAGGIWYSTAGSTKFAEHYHEELEINLVLRGNLEYAVRSRFAGPPSTLELRAGNVLWLAPGVPHELLRASPDLAMWVVSLRPELVSEIAGSMSLMHPQYEAEGLFVSDWHSDALRRVSVLCADALSVALTPASNTKLHQLLEVCLIEARAASDRPAPLRPLIHPAVRKAASLVVAAEHTREHPLALPELAQLCHLSAPRLSRLFSEQMGLSLVQYRNHHRVQQFIRELGDGRQKTTLEVALQVGFGSYPQLHRSFRQVTGYSPSQHLQRVRAGIVLPVPQGAVVVGDRQKLIDRPELV